MCGGTVVATIFYLMPMDAKFMDAAIALSKEAAKNGEIPVGAVVVKDGEIIGRGKNMREEKHSALSHAECEAIKQANAALSDWRLDGCSIYVTLEPCTMCMGAIMNARIKEVVFGAFRKDGGASHLASGDMTVFSSVREEECKKVLDSFFKNLRG